MTETDFDLEMTNTVKGIIKESQRITPESTDEIRHIVIEIDDPAFRYVEGQNIGILIPGPHPFGNKYHHRRYSIASARSSQMGENLEIEILVRRCFYNDEISGERYPGIASNYICDAKIGDTLEITGPYRSSFKIPTDSESNLLMIGTGTGIAPFRAFVTSIYKERGGWDGKVRLFYGANSGMELLYMNDINNDLTNYYDEETFKAFQSVNKHALTDEDVALQKSIEDHATEALELIKDPKTYVFLAGMKKAVDALDKAMSAAVGSEDEWQDLKKRLVDEERWSELVYH